MEVGRKTKNTKKKQKHKTQNKFFKKSARKRESMFTVRDR
jgi:hypothetical protein